MLWCDICHGVTCAEFSTGVCYVRGTGGRSEHYLIGEMGNRSSNYIKHKQDREFFKEGFIHKVYNMFKYKLVALSFEGEI